MAQPQLELNEVINTANEGVLASLGLNWQLFGLQLLNFAIIVLILWFLILKPLSKKMEERRKIIDQSLDNAKEVETNLTMSEQKFKEKIEQAELDSSALLEKADKEARNLVMNMKDKAKDEIKVLIDQAKEKITKEREVMMNGIKKEAAELIVSALEKILNEKIDNKKDQELIKQAIQEFKPIYEDKSE